LAAGEDGSAAARAAMVCVDCGRTGGCMRRGVDWVGMMTSPELDHAGDD
jgi:hypothetical protein